MDRQVVMVESGTSVLDAVTSMIDSVFWLDSGPKRAPKGCYYRQRNTSEIRGNPPGEEGVDRESSFESLAFGQIVRRANHEGRMSLMNPESPPYPSLRSNFFISLAISISNPKPEKV